MSEGSDSAEEVNSAMEGNLSREFYWVVGDEERRRAATEVVAMAGGVTGK